MSALFARAALKPFQCSLLQSSVLQPTLLARQANYNLPLCKLFHASPFALNRKPNKAVVKPSQLPPTPKRVRVSIQSHPPTGASHDIPKAQLQHVITSTKAVGSDTSSSDIQQPLAHRQPAVPSFQPAATSRTASIPTPAPFSGRPLPSYQAFVEKLALRDESTVIYTAQSQTMYVSVCIAAALFVNWVAYITWKNYEPAVAQGNTILAISGVINCSIWLFIGGYFAWGPVGLIKRIVALPATAALKQLPNPRPTLRLEPCSFGLKGWPKPIEVKMGDVYSDRLFSLEISKIRKYVGTSEKPSLIDEYFGWIKRLWTANVKMFARAQRFTYIRVNDKANFKLDLRDCQTIEDGRGKCTFVIPEARGRLY